MDDVDDAHETEADDELGNGATKEDRRMIKQLKLRTEVMNMMMGNLETLFGLIRPLRLLLRCILHLRS